MPFPPDSGTRLWRSCSIALVRALIFPSPLRMRRNQPSRMCCTVLYPNVCSIMIHIGAFPSALYQTSVWIFPRPSFTGLAFKDLRWNHAQDQVGVCVWRMCTSSCSATHTGTAFNVYCATIGLAFVTLDFATDLASAALVCPLLCCAARAKGVKGDAPLFSHCG